GIQSEIVSYDVYLNYPKKTRLALLQKSGQNTASYTTLYEAKLQEDVLPEDPTTGHPERIPSFHGYSARYVLPFIPFPPRCPSLRHHFPFYRFCVTLYWKTPRRSEVTISTGLLSSTVILNSVLEFGG